MNLPKGPKYPSKSLFAQPNEYLPPANTAMNNIGKTIRHFIVGGVYVNDSFVCKQLHVCMPTLIFCQMIVNPGPSQGLKIRGGLVVL